MIGKKTLESKPIPAAKVKEILEEFSEKHELSYEQNLTLDHATDLKKLSLEKKSFKHLLITKSIDDIFLIKKLKIIFSLLYW
jgi:DNA-directed RNA polymerase subunit F